MVLVQNVKNGKQSGEMILKVKGEKTRLDLPMMGISVLADGDTVAVLQHASRIYTLLRTEQIEFLTRKSATDALLNPQNPKETGIKENLGPYSCKVYTAENGNIKWRYWVCKEYPNGPEILRQINKLSRGMGCLPKIDGLPGLPLKVEQVYKGTKITTTLVSATDGELAASDFELPSGYNPSPTPDVENNTRLSLPPPQGPAP